MYIYCTNSTLITSISTICKSWSVLILLSSLHLIFEKSIQQCASSIIISSRAWPGPNVDRRLPNTARSTKRPVLLNPQYWFRPGPWARVLQRSVWVCWCLGVPGWVPGGVPGGVGCAHVDPVAVFEEWKRSSELQLSPSGASHCSIIFCVPYCYK